MRLADELGCPTLSVLAGSRLAGVSMVIQLNTFRENLAWALPRAAAAGRTLTLELLNPDDAPRTCSRTPPGPARCSRPSMTRRCASSSTRTSSGAWFRTSRRASASWPRWSVMWTLADAPDRHEPGTGAIEWTAFFAVLADSGYDGTVGLRYHRARRRSRASAGSRPTGSSARNRPDGSKGAYAAAINPPTGCHGFADSEAGCPGPLHGGTSSTVMSRPGIGIPADPERSTT